MRTLLTGQHTCSIHRTASRRRRGSRCRASARRLRGRRRRDAAARFRARNAKVEAGVGDGASIEAASAADTHESTRMWE